MLAVRQNACRTGSRRTAKQTGALVMDSYPFADRAAEDKRLIAQGTLFDPLTRRLLQQAGIAPGMRVLDLGSGAGNVARIAAEMVGPTGAVVGIEKDPAAVELAQRRA